MSDNVRPGLEDHYPEPVPTSEPHVQEELELNLPSVTVSDDGQLANIDGENYVKQTNLESAQIDSVLTGSEGELVAIVDSQHVGKVTSKTRDIVYFIGLGVAAVTFVVTGSAPIIFGDAVGLQVGAVAGQIASGFGIVASGLAVVYRPGGGSSSR